MTHEKVHLESTFQMIRRHYISRFVTLFSFCLLSSGVTSLFTKFWEKKSRGIKMYLTFYPISFCVPEETVRGKTDLTNN